ncbi:ABC transporter substrate-binding protein [Reyranella sp.]|uniref:ABC transporter substrate-binding protein n=1 Tax=Reyranella sp. TaxID=1929291 RepID=UPI003F6FA9F8
MPFRLRTLLALVATLSLPLGAAEAQDSRTAIVAVGGDPGHLNPAISTASPVHAVADSIFNGLVSLDRDGTVRPDLATGWSVAEDGREVRFTLASGVTWHDGKPFTAQDVKFTFEEVLFRFHARTRAGLAPAVESIEAPDANTLIFRLKRPHPALLRQLDVTEAPILPRHLYAGTDPNRNEANARPVGTGAFRFESYRRDESVVLVRNESYFKPGLPKLDRLIFRVIPETATQIAALANGEVDYLGRVAPADVARLKGKATLVETTAGPGGANCIMTLAFNLQRPALAALPVRQAFAHALDRRQMLDVVQFGQGRVAEAPIHSAIGWATLPGALQAYGLDTAKANGLLDQAKLPRTNGGERATFDLLMFPAFARYAELMRQQLAQVGIVLRLKPLDPAAFATAVFAQRDFDLALISYCNGVDPEIGVRRMYHSSAVGNVPFSNAAGYRNSEVDRLFDEAGASIDTAKRGEAYRAMERIVAHDLPYWWLVETDFTSAWRGAFVDFAPWSGPFAERAAPAR